MLSFSPIKFCNNLLFFIDDVTEALQWLKHNKQPWKEVVQNWRKTLKYRYENLTKTAGTIDDYINQYPILAHSDGFTLISLDFHELFKSKDIFTAWEPFFEWSYSTASANKLRKAKDLTILLSADVSECKYNLHFTLQK